MAVWSPEPDDDETKEEVDIVPLVIHQAEPTKQGWNCKAAIVLIGATLSGLLLFLFTRDASYILLDTVEEINPGVGPIGPTLQELEIAPFVDKTANAVPPLSLQEQASERTTKGMQQDLDIARERLHHKLMGDYGKYYFEHIFLETTKSGHVYSRGRTIFQSANTVNGHSWERLKRKMMIKLLRVQLQHDNDNDKVPFVWATGGDSLAAGHGNLYEESYTSYLGKAATDVFDAVGIEFSVRNYAMGSTQSAPEVAFCSKEIFGQDVDILVWDFGMTDASDTDMLSLFLRRAGLNRGRPALLANRLGKRYFQARKAVLEEIEDLGLTVLYSSELILDRAAIGIPDSDDLDTEQLNQVPMFVRNLRCRGALEDGKPECNCVEEKFNVTVCNNRPFRTSWHAGW